MPGKIKVKTFCLLPSSLSHVTQRAPYPRPAVAHFQRIPKHGVGEPFNGLCFAGLKKKKKRNETDVGCYSPVTPDQHLDSQTLIGALTQSPPPPFQ